MVNQIATKTFLNPFSGLTYYNVQIDGILLEDIILSKVKEEIIPGLVPTLLNWLNNEDERKVVWDRAFPSIGEKSKLPILMCSEDIDLWCTLIIVEVTRDNDFVYWNKFGLENSDAQIAEEIAKSVEWFKEVNSMKFDLKQYEFVLNEFRKFLREKNNNPYPPKLNEKVNVWEFKSIH